MKVLHFDCYAGISGDMALGAFVDLGIDPGKLRTALESLGLSGWKLDFVRDERCGIAGTRAIVELDDHGHQHEHGHRHDHAHQHGHTHEGEHPHNSWKEIRRLIENAELPTGAKRRALDIFNRIAAAEAQAHGVPADEVVFHEVGAMDSIIDIVGAAVCLDMLKPDRITCSEVELGGGEARCAHGILPVPAPAVRILTTGMPVRTGGFNKEMTTPTGAAILASCVDEFIAGPCSFRPVKTAYGIGTRKMEKPNVLQLSWREVAAMAANPGDEKPWTSETLLLLEANIDDMTGEALGFLMERFFESGALDVTFTPLTMKKSRPGVAAAVLCRRENADALRETFFRHSTTIGFRETTVNRLSLKRELKTVRGEFGAAQEKIVSQGGGKTRSKIEYEDRARLAREQGVSLDEAEAIIRGASCRA
ncbi:MAG: nickel pincer cofactor biosynthesis protein LarC [Treponema sp.]|jgi:uncharacterized protein (TIGR00299 family) protein|nr:nickel pincer cofactor biosynthesis protein LarC [Treponema sp.]